MEWRKNGNWDLKTQTIKGYFETAIERLTKKTKQKNQVTNLIVDLINFNGTTNEEIIKVLKRNKKRPLMSKCPKKVSHVITI